VAEVEVLIGKLTPIDGLATGAILIRKVTALAHEARNHPMKWRTCVAKALLARAQRAKVFGCLRHHAAEETHLDTTSRLAA
jgi:hypothetical protein